MLILSWELTLLSVCVVPIFIYLTYRVGRERCKIASSTQKVAGRPLRPHRGDALGLGRAPLEGVRPPAGRDRAVPGGESAPRRASGTPADGRRGFFRGRADVLRRDARGGPTRGGLLISGGSTALRRDDRAFTALQTRLLFPVGSLLQVSTEIQSSLALFERVFQYLDLEHDIVDAPDAVTLPRDEVVGRIDFRDVSFRYDEPRLPPALVEVATEAEAANGTDGKRPSNGLFQAPRLWTLEDVSLEIEPGQLAAVVGPSGAARRPWPTSYRASTTSSRGRSRSTATTSGRYGSRPSRI